MSAQTRRKLIAWQGIQPVTAGRCANFHGAHTSSRRLGSVQRAYLRAAPQSLLVGLSAWWGLHEASGSRLDSSGNSHTLSEAGGTVDTADGLIGLAALFEASANLATTDAIITSGNFSFSCWVNLTDTSTDYYLMGQATSGKPRLVAGLSGVTFGVGATTNLITYAVAPTEATWVHIVGTKSSNTIKLFVNGIMRATASKTTSFGTAFSVADSNTLATIQLAGVWSRALADGSPSVDGVAGGEVALLYHNAQGLDYGF